MLNYTKLLFLAGILTACGTLKNQSTLPDEFQAQLEQLFPDAVITKMDIEGHFEQSYQVELNQLLDHNDPDAGTFKQYVYLSHFSATAPTVLVTEGYAAYPGKYELSEYLEANQVMVEYRFYGKSKPDSIPWEYLTNDQAIEDYHTLVAKLKTLYPGKWLSTGISKGGETVLIYESKYPEDIDVAVPYVAPLIDTREDPRTDEHINSVGTAKCRTKIIRFQRSILENREAVLKEVKKYADEKKMTFKEVSVEEALEYAVLELDQIIQENAAAAEETASTSTQLASQASMLQEIMSFFNVGGQKQTFTQFSNTTAIPQTSKQVEPTPQLAHTSNNGSITSSTPLLSNSESFNSHNDNQEFERY